MKINTIRINEMITPLGLDEEKPVFSWLFEEDPTGQKKNEVQTAAQILVGTAPGQRDAWDSGVLETGRSIGIRYAGAPLQPMTRYYVKVRVCSEKGEWSETESWFETGLLCENMAFRGAKWIGAPEYALAADTLNAFVLESTFRIEKGRRAGIVFGANDPRLKDKDKNEMLLSGESGIVFIINVEGMPDTSAALEIYRYGYSDTDSRQKPLYVLGLRDIRTGEEVITPENMRALHTLRIEMEGNGAYTYLDGHPVDESTRPTSVGDIRSPRLLNPLGILDVITYPRLCSIGYYVDDDAQAYFADGIHVKNLRFPGNEICTLDADGLRIVGRHAEEGKAEEQVDAVERKAKKQAGSEENGMQVDAEKVKAEDQDCSTETFPAQGLERGFIRITDPSCHSIPMLRRRFVVGEAGRTLKKARLYATARGIYRCLVNGAEIDDVYFAPGASQYDHHLMYQTYDITDRLAPGENVLGATLASGWWSDAFSFRIYNTNFWGDRPSFLAMLVLTYEDGTEETITTDSETWEYFGEGPVRYAGFFNGEHYDARREEAARRFFVGASSEAQLQLRTPEEILPVPIGAHEGIFPGACIWPAVNEREPVLTGSYQAPVKLVETFTAKTRTEVRPGVYVYDLGQEIAGVPRITFDESAGTRITIRYAEMLYPDLERYEGLQGTLLQANLRDAMSTDIYICKGGAGEAFSPKFTFHGFRYLEITGAQNPPRPEDVQGLLLSSVTEMTGRFICSDPLVNRLVKNVRYSQYCNFISIPTDCPQRNERMGWTGDTQAFCRTANLQSSVKNFYLRNLQAMADLQTEDGRLPCIAPFGGGFGGMTYESAMILIVRELYAHYGDRDVVETYFPVMDAWMDSMERIGLPGKPQVSFKAWLGDWLAPQGADEYLIFNAFHYRNAVCMGYFAGLLGKVEEKEKYAGIATRTKLYWNETFADPRTGVTKNADGSICDVQGSYAIALDCGVFDDALKEKAFAHLARKTVEGDCTVGTGFFGTGPLNYMLSAGGYPDIAGKTVTNTKCPGWLYPVTQGATTVWERWDSFTAENGFGESNSMNSFNHYSLGSVVGWLYENVLGIRRDPASPGYDHFILQPETGTFRYAGGCIHTPHGVIESSWEWIGEKDTLEQEAPDALGQKAPGSLGQEAPDALEGSRNLGQSSATGAEEKGTPGPEGSICYRCKIPPNTSAELILGERRMLLGSGTYELRI